MEYNRANPSDGGNIPEVAEIYSSKAQLLDAMLNFATWIGECAKLALAVPGALALARHIFCPHRPKSFRDVATQSQCTYTALRDVQHPRFLFLEENKQGAFLK